MPRIATFLCLACMMAAHSGAVPAEPPFPSLHWSATVVNHGAQPQRELLVHAWYPGGDAELYRALVILVPGRGVASSGYAYTVGTLVERGYVVVAVDRPGSGRQEFPDGRVVPPDPALIPPPGLMAGPYVEVDRFFSSVAADGAADLAFVLDWLSEVRAGDTVPFTRRVAMDRVGLLGHSLGGRIAGAFAAQDPRAAAWIGVEGLAPRAARRRGLGVPALAILGAGVWPYAIANVRELAWCARRPTYFAMIPGMEHNTILGAAGSASASAQSTALGQLNTVILDFFQHHMIDPREPLRRWPDAVVVETHLSESAERPDGVLCHG